MTGLDDYPLGRPPREKPVDEIRQEFLDNIAGLTHYWATLIPTNPADTLTELGRMTGLVHSILTLLDGCVSGSCGFVVAPSPHPDDRAYFEEQGEDWYPEAPIAQADIAGGLHELWPEAEIRGALAERVDGAYRTRSIDTMVVSVAGHSEVRRVIR